MAEKLDIRKTGPASFRQLQEENNSLYNSGLSPEYIDFVNNIGAQSAPISLFDASYQAPTEVQSSTGDFGKSMFDEETLNEEQFGRIQDIRAENQPWLAKLGAGITKGAVLAGTTFIDGTVGLISGLGQGIYNLFDKDDTTNFGSGLFNNAVSNAIHSINQGMEELLPNYRSEIEQERKWYQNLGTVNFWADGFLKNLGFTVGAFYSGNALTKALGAMKLIKGAMGAKVAGSALSAVNEARVEANNNSNDFVKLESAKIDDWYQKQMYRILSQNIPDYNKAIMLEDLDANKEELYHDLDVRAKNMGVTDLIGNSVFLYLDNMFQFGRLYARGFKNARDITQTGVKKSVMEETSKLFKREGADEIAKRVKGKIGALEWDKITTGSVIAKGFAKGAVEGNEELAQAFLADYAGARKSPDDPDSYYKSVLDGTAEDLTNDFLTSVTKSFANTYGNFDRYEEFAIGALTGLLGVPTFGKLNNSDSNTYLGKGKTIGLSGGVFGEITHSKALNTEGQADVEVANKIANKILDSKRHFVQSQSFSNIMDGYAEDGDAFEYKNAEDNDDFVSADRFAKLGKLAEYKELVDQDYDNISDEELREIATTTEPPVGSKYVGWKDVDGKLLSETPEGRAKMKAELREKKEKILKGIDDYVNSVEEVRAIGNNSLTDDQVEELAWLNWKSKRFETRYEEIKDENTKLFDSLQKGLQEWKNDLIESRKDMVEYISKDKKSEDFEANEKWLNHVKGTMSLIEQLREKKNILGLSSFLKDNPKIKESLTSKDFYDLFADKSNMTFDEYKKAMTNLIDTSRLATAAGEFNKRYKEFTEDPTKIIKNRNKLKEKVEKVRKVHKDIKTKEKIKEMSVPDLVASGELDGWENFDFEEEIPEGEEASPESTKLKTAKEISEKSSILRENISSRSDVDQQTKADAIAMLDKSKQYAENPEELDDTTSQVFNDPTSLVEDSSIENMDMSPEDIQAMMAERTDSAKTLIEEEAAALRSLEKDLGRLPKRGEGTVVRSAGQNLIKEDKTAGRDGSETGIPENQPKATKEEKINLREEADKISEALGIDLDSDDGTMLDMDIANVLYNISEYIKAGANGSEVKKNLADTESFKELTDAYPNVIPFLQDFENRYRKEVEGDTTQKEKSSTEEISDQEKLKDETSTITPSRESLNVQIDNENKRSLGEELKEESPDKYWNSVTSEFAIHGIKGDFRPYIEIAKASGKYSEAQIKKMEAIYDYLKNHGAYTRISSGEIKEGSTVHFLIDSKLNKDASLNGDANNVVILITDSEGNVIGDLNNPVDGDLYTKKYGLPEIYRATVKEWEDAGKPEIFMSKKYSSVIDRVYPGRVPYDSIDNRRTINTIYGNTPFMIGVSVSSGKNAKILAKAGRTKKQGRLDWEKKILSPLNATSGQPYLLMKTGSDRKKYITVPFTMPEFSAANTDSALGKAIVDLVKELSTLDPRKKRAELSWVDEMRELLNIPNFEKDGKVQRGLYLKVKDGNVLIYLNDKNGVSKELYSGAQDNPEMVDTIVRNLYGVPFHISRKYMNENYRGQSYNRMIGELAETNLPIGSTHTINDWVTVRPLFANGSLASVSSPKNTRVNPANINAIPVVTIKGEKFSVSANNEIKRIKDDKKISVENGYTEKQVNTIIAFAECQKNNNHKRNEFFRTSRGLFNPVTLEIKDEIEVPETTAPAPKTKVEEIKTTPTEDINIEELTNIVTSKGLLGDANRKLVWENLNPQQKSALANKKGPKQAQWMTKLASAFNPSDNTFDSKVLGGDVDALLNISGKYRKVSEETPKVWNRRKEERWLKRALPNLSNPDRLRVEKGLIKVAGSPNNEVAWGQFKQGIITVSELAAPGTLYHEAFHSVVSTLMSDEEVKDMFDAATEVYGNLPQLTLEENLAEDFRRYVQLEEKPVTGRLVKLFRKIKHLVKSLLGKEPYLDNLFYRINRGEYSEKVPTSTSAIRNRDEEYTKEMKDILADAPRNSEGKLLAPNGKVSNLNERQYAQVRTKAFKEWFGDWINDPENASKVVDENGEPLVVYHTSYTRDITKFNKDEDGLIYFGDGLTASTYSYADYHVFLNIRNPYRFEGKLPEKGKPALPISLALDEAGYEGKLGENKTYRIGPKQYTEGQDGTIYTNISDVGEGLAEGGIEEANKFWEEYKKQGYGKVYAVTDSNQIKSATDNIGTFSTTNDDIRYRKAVEQHYRDKMMFGNLSQAQKDYMNDRNISIDEYNSMSQLEKEVLFRCM